MKSIDQVSGNPISCDTVNFEVKGNGRNFGYSLNPKRAKAKLLKGAKRTKNLDVEVKTGCVNMRFDDGSYFEVVLPLLRQWHGKEKEYVKINETEMKVEESDPGIESSEKHVDTKLVIITGNDRLVLHAYNSTQNLMVQGKNFENFAINCLEPYFSNKIKVKLDAIVKFNNSVQNMLGQDKPAIKKKDKMSKPFQCPHCKVKNSTVADLRMHVKSSHSMKIQNGKKETIMYEDISILSESETSMHALEDHSELNIDHLKVKKINL